MPEASKPAWKRRRARTRLAYNAYMRQWRKQNLQRIAQYRRDRKARAVAYLGGRCMDCGYNKCLAALDFHHLRRKSFPIAQHIGARWSLLRKELDKCDLLCRNCHAERHARAV